MVSQIVEKILINKTDIWQHSLATLAAVISRLSLFFITLISTQFFSPHEFGIFTLLLLFTNIVSAFVSCGGDMWLNRFTRQRHAQGIRSPIVSGFYFKVSASLAGIVILTALGLMSVGHQEVLGKLSGHELAVGYALLWAAVSGFMETILAILRTTNQIQRFFIIRDFIMPITLIVTVLLFKINSCLQFFTMAFFLWLGALAYLLKYIFKQKELFKLNANLGQTLLKKNLMSYTINLILNNFSSRFINALDTLILTFFLPLDLIGKYRLMAHSSNAFTVVQHFVFLTLPWHMRQSKDQLSNHQNRNTIRLRQLLLICSIIPALLILIFFTKFFLDLLGPGFQALAPVLIAFLLIRFSDLLWGPQHEKLISNNMVLQDTFANGLGIFACIIAFWVLVQFFPAITSTVAAAGLSSVLIQLIRYFYLKQNKIVDSGKTDSNFHFPWFPIILVVITIGYLVHYAVLE